MKHFKKLLTAVLAGVLALALAGCNFVCYDEAEFIRQMGDHDTVSYQKTGEARAAIVEDTLRQALEVARTAEESSQYPQNPSEMLSLLSECPQSAPPEFVPDSIKKLYLLQQKMFDQLKVDPEGDDICYLSFASLEGFDSTHFRKSLEDALTASALENRYSYFLKTNSGPYDSRLDDLSDTAHPLKSGTVSLKLIDLDGRQYLLGVWTVAA